MSAPEAKGAIPWMARNPVAANVILAFLLIGGVMTGFNIRQEVFPYFSLDYIHVTVPYPGTSPEEVEKGIVLPIEEAVRGIEGVERVTATASEGSGRITVELYEGLDTSKALSDVKNAVDRITTIPEDAERPIVQLAARRVDVITLVLYGDQEEKVLEQLGQQVRDELLRLEEVTTVELKGVRSQQINVEIEEDTLRGYGLTLESVAAIINNTAREISAGAVRADSGEILLRVQERRDWARQFEDVPIISRPDGTVVRLGDIAEIKDGYEDTDVESYFNGKRAVMIDVAREGEQTPIEVSRAVKNYVEDLRERLPAGIGVDTFKDRAEIYQDRVDLLMKNAFIGLCLVLVLLGVFLNARLAFWVAMGIPASFMGCLFVLPYFDVSINMISLFAFIMALGMVVDDAIVVGENIYTMRKSGMSGIGAAIAGTKQMAVPVCFAIGTNIIAFAPLLMMEGIMQKFMRSIPIVVILVFLASLIEALFILPAHLAHARQGDESGVMGWIGVRQQRVADAIERWIEGRFRPFLTLALHNRYLTISIGVSILAMVLGYMSSGRIAMELAPSAEGDGVVAGIYLPYGVSVEETEAALQRVVKAAQKVIGERGGDRISEGIVSNIGRSGPGRHAGGSGIRGSHLAYVEIFLVPQKQREFSAKQFSNWWREETGEIPGVEALLFEARRHGPGGGTPIDLELSHRDSQSLEEAASDLAGILASYQGTRDIDDGFIEGKPQLDFKLRPEAYSLGLTPRDLGRQVRGAFYGIEALRMQRAREEIKVMVRYPESERRSEGAIEDMIVQAPGGTELLLSEAARVERGRSYTQINRADGQRIINVTSDVTPRNLATNILANLDQERLPRLAQKYPGLTWEMGGEERERVKGFNSLIQGLVIALVGIFAVLAFVFRSYAQPLIIMVAIPFGIVGAVLGHALMGYNMSIISMMGVVALSGVVVNDTLVLIDYANQRRREGATALQAAIDAGTRRFRPVILTTVTTFFGLAPMIFETSFQAKMIIPMAISLGYGELFSTTIILLLVPCVYLVVEDAKARLGMGAKVDNVDHGLVEQAREAGLAGAAPAIGPKEKPEQKREE